MSNFIPSKPNNPCQNCGDTDGDCRQLADNPDKILCMKSFGESDAAPGWKFTGRKSGSQWGVLVVAQDDWDEQRKEQWRFDQQAKLERRRKEREEQLANSMPAAERDTYYRQIIEQLKLHPDDRANLVSRGMDDHQIKRSQFVSVQQWQKLEAELPHLLPGVNLSGLGLVTGAVGYLCPCIDVHGHIAGFQVRRRRLEEGQKNRYYWLSSYTKKTPTGQGPNLPNDEPPLTVRHPIELKRKAIGLAEGTGAKPFLGAEWIGIPFIGAAGGMFPKSPETLKESLEVLSEQMGGVEVIELYPDAGMLTNRDVMSKYENTLRLIEGWGFNVQVCWWGQIEKGNDIDQISDFSQIRNISTEDFLAMAPQNEEDKKALVKSAAKAAPQGSMVRLNSSHVGAKSSKVSPIRAGVDPNFDLLSAIQELSNKNLSDSETDCEILEIAQKSGYQPNEVRRTLEDLRKEVDFDDDLDERKQEIEKLSTYEDYDLPLKSVLHHNLVGRIDKMAEYLGSKPSAFLITLLCVTSSLCRTGTQVQLQAATGGNAQSILFGGICGESGSAKSPTQKIILKPIFRLQNESESQYNAEKAEYDRARNAGEVDLEEPTPREYWTGNYTTEALTGIISKQRHGFAIYLDELSSVVTGMGQYKGGKGNDRETMLSGRDGSPIKVNRKTERLAAAQSSYSVVGATTPGVLRQLMKDFSDESGFWARFLWVYLPVLPMPYVDEDSSDYEELQQALYEAYIRIGHYEPTVYKLSSEAKEIYRDWFDKLDERRLNESRPALRSVYNKAKFNTGEIALALHVLNSAVEGLRQPPEEISKKTMKAAVKVASFLMIQVNLIHRIGAEAAGDLSAIQSKILELAKRKGSITAVDVRRGVRFFKDGKNSDSTAILKHFKALEKMGLGILEGKRFTMNALDAEE
ncbi:DUF3987 domain-containing protein [Candidatus Woesearchaeota archaeon]|nr:DUF3987 domain-containing protein [Candidatus Woesearchaeota archaeon]